jgi:hypothetical protein
MWSILKRSAATTVVLGGVLTAIPVPGFAAPAAQAHAQSSTKQQKPAAMASHATTGVVAAVDATSLVLTRPSKPGGEMKFVLNPATRREGTVEVGSSVSVRYHEDGKTNVATAITAEHPKQQAAHKGATY